MTGLAIRDLTGSPYEFLKNENVQKSWEFLVKNRMFVLTAGSQASKSESGIVEGHAYAILDVQEVARNGGSVRLIQLRNPWGQGEWKGRWSDGSSEWSEDVKKKLKYQNKDDGIFWMQVEDFVSSFEEVCVNKLHEDYIYSSRRVRGHQQGFMKFYSTVANQHTYVTLSQKDKRFGRQQYSLVRCILWKGARGQKIQVIGDAFGCHRDLTVELNLKDKDSYGLYYEVDWADNADRQLVVSAYSQYETLFDDAEPIKIKEEQELLLSQLLDGSNTSKCEIQRYPENNLVAKLSATCGGYVFIRYSNNTDSSTLFENLKLTNVKNLTNTDRTKITLDHKVQLPPKKTHILFFRISPEEQGAFNYSQEYSYRIISKVTDEELLELAEKKPNRTIQRKNGKELLEVFVYDYMYDEGLAIVYKNKGINVYEEKLQLELENLKSDQTTFHIILKTQEKYLIRLETVNQSKPISYSSSYVGGYMQRK